MPTERIPTTMLLGVLLGIIFGIGGLLYALPPARSEYFTLDQATRMQARGFYAAERTPQGRGFRWSDANSRVVFGNGGSHPAVLSLTLAAPRPTAITVPLTLLINNTLTSTVPLDGTPRHVHLLIPSAASRTLENRVTLLSPTMYVDDGANPRQLGVVLFAAGWRLVQPLAWLLPAQILLLGSVAALLLVSLHLPFLWRVGLTVLVVLLLLLSGHVAPLPPSRLVALVLTGVVLLLFSIGWLATRLPKLRRLLGWGGWGLSFLLLTLCLIMGVAPLVMIAAALVAPLLLAGWQRIRLPDLRKWLGQMVQAHWLALLSLPLLALFFTVRLACNTNDCHVTTRVSMPIHSDGEGYYAYLPALLIDHDIRLSSRFAGQSSLPLSISPYGASGAYLIKYPLGVALLMLPLFLVGHGLSLVTGQPTHGFTLLYQVLATLTAPLLVLAGLALLRQVLLQFVPRSAALLTLVCLLFGTNLLHYATLDASFSHAYGFALVAALLFLTPRWYAHPHWRTTLLLGIVCGVLVLIRNTHLILAPLLLCYAVWSGHDLAARLRWLWHWRGQSLLLLISFGVTLLPQLLYWQIITGQWVVYAYRDKGFAYWHTPYLLDMLIGVQRGVLLWFPVLLLCVPGLWLALRQRNPYAPSTLLVLAIFWYLTASWHDPTYGHSFGLRVLVDLLPLLAIPFALTLAHIQQQRWWAVQVVVLLLMLFSLLQMFSLWQGNIDMAHPDWDDYTHVFVVMWQWLSFSG